VLERRTMRDEKRTAPKRDLDSRLEIEEMVRRFYGDVAMDELLGPVFNDVAHVDWPEHLLKLTAYWCRVLLELPAYGGNPFRAHAGVHAQSPLTAAHFERWLELFHDTLEGGWTGPRVDRAGEVADTVARIHSKQLIGRAVSVGSTARGECATEAP
jgi:hemoglobin